MKNICQICGSINFIKKWNDVLIECNDCGFISTNLELSDAEIEEIYSEKYFKGEEYSDYEADKASICLNFEKRLQYLQHNNLCGAMSNVLEIGCSYGFFGETLLRKFPQAQYLGVDVAQTAVEKGRLSSGLNLQFADYSSFATTAEYSNVFMWDVIEHLRFPQLFIEKISNEIQPNGLLYITTGNIQSRNARLRGNAWRIIHPPTHLHYFSEETINRLLKNHGFAVMSVSYPWIWRSMKQTFFSLFLLNRLQLAIFKWIYNTIPEKLNFPFNLWDIMMVVAQKK